MGADGALLLEPQDVETVRLRSRMRRWPLQHLEFLVRANRYVVEHGGAFDLVNDHSRLIRRARCPLVTTVHSTEEQELRIRAWESQRPSLKAQVQRTGLVALSAWERRNIMAADRLLTVSSSMAEYLRRRFGRPGAGLALPGIDLSHFAPGHEERTTDVLFVGRFHPRKGIRELRAALDRLPPLSVVLCGGGGDRREVRDIRAWIESTRHRVRLRIDVPHAEIPSFYREARLLVVPSLYEPFGMVAVEGMASGTPVVASRVGGLSDHVRDGEEGFLVPPGDPGALADAIRRVLDREDERRRMGENALARASRYSWGAAAEASLRAFALSLRDSDCEARP